MLQGARTIILRIQNVERESKTPDADAVRFYTSAFVQPPLEYYLRVISSQPWSKVSILTSGGKYRLLNPVYVALKNMTITGQLGPNVILHHVSAFL